MTTHAIFVGHFEDDEADGVNSVFYPLWSDSGKSRHEFINDVFRAGLATVKVKSNPNDKETKRKQRTLQHAMQLQERDGYNKLVEIIFERSSEEEFAAYCKAEEIDLEEFKQRYAAKLPDRNSWSLRALAILDEMLRDGDYHRQDEIREVAQKKGLIQDEGDWNHMRVIATRNNLTSDRRGYWRKQ